MACRMVWQDLYAIEQRLAPLAAMVTGAPSFLAASKVGIRGTGAANGVFTCLLTDHPDMKAPTSTVENALTTGKPIRNVVEYNQVAAQPATVTLNMLANAYNLSLFLLLMYQSGASEAVGSTNNSLNVLACIPYTTSDVSYYSYIARIMSDNTDQVDQVLKGAICRQLTLNAEEGGLLTLAAEMVGAKWVQADMSPALTTLKTTFDDTTPLKWQDATCKISGTSVTARSFSVTVNAEPLFAFYNSDSLQNICLGRLTATGTIVIPWGDPSYTKTTGHPEINDFISGADKSVTIYWGSSDAGDCSTPKGGGTDTKNYVGIKMNARVTDYNLTGDSEILIECQFTAVDDTSHTNNTISFYCGYDKTYLERI